MPASPPPRAPPPARAPPGAPAPAGPDRTRGAGLLGSTEWNDCPFPQEADAEQIDEAQVTIQVHVKPDGRAEKVVVLSDPGHGFGREARMCAMRKSFQVALDREGHALPGVTRRDIRTVLSGNVGESGQDLPFERPESALLTPLATASADAFRP